MRLDFGSDSAWGARASAAAAIGPLARFREPVIGAANNDDPTATGDLRTLPVRYDPSGERWRDFDNAIEQTAFAEFHDFPTSRGPAP